MDKNKYQTLQEWHELLKSGIITEEDFNKKKRELIGDIESTSQKEQPDLSIETSAKEVSKPEQDKRNSNNWFNKNKSWLISLIIVVLIGIIAFIWYFPNEEKSDFNEETGTMLEEEYSNENIEPEYSYYIVKPNENGRAYFHTEPDFTTRKNAYFTQNEIVYIQQIENGFGYVEFTNDKGKTSKGWIFLGNLIQKQITEKHSNTGIEYEVIEVVDSLLAFKCKLTYFPTIRNKKLIKTIYDTITVNKEYWQFTDYSKKGLRQAINKHKQYLAKDEDRVWAIEHTTKNNITEYVKEWGFFDDVSLDVFSTSGNAVTVAYVFNGHRGGVGWDTKNYLTFDKNKERLISLSDMLKDGQRNNKEWHQILKRYAITHNGQIENDEIPISNSFYFDKNAVTFVYQKYEISMGADGVVHIRVPFTNIWEYLKPEFIDQYL